MTTRGELFVCGVFVGLAAYGVIAYTMLGAGMSVSLLLAPLCLAGGTLGSRFWRGSAAAAEPEVRRAISIGVWGLVALVVAALVWGALATPARHWDGTTSWQLRADVLATNPTLEQMFFRDPGVYAHSREYPLLQPLLVASLGRIALPAMFVLLIACAALTWRRAGVAPVARRALVLGLALTPMHVAPTSGAVDSGFAEVSAAACVMAIAAGLTNRDAILLGSATLLLPLIKPEGVAYIPVVATACWLFGTRLQLVTAAVCGAVGLLLWASLYVQLTYSNVSLGSITAALATAAAVGIGTRLATEHRPRARVAVFAFACLVTIAVLVAAQNEMDSVGGVLGAYLQGGRLAAERITDIPQIVTGLFAEMAHVRKFGLGFVLLFLLALLPRRHVGRCPSRVLAAMVSIGLVSQVVPFLLSPEGIEHHLRSSADRLLLHWLGPAWLLAGLWWAEAITRQPGQNGDRP